jgi:hypothetical protein
MARIAAGPLLWAALALLTGTASPAQVRAGAARRIITPELARGPVWLAGFGQKRAATGVHDELWARCLALGEGRRTLALCAVDSIGLFLEDVEQIRRLVRERMAAEVAVAATHVHQAPDTMGLWGPAPGVSGINPDYNRLVIERTAEAAVEAARSMRPALFKAARVASAELDGFIHDTRPPVVLDSELIVLSAAGRDGGTIATVVNWANHPETLGSRNTLVTADYPGFLYRRLEERLGGTALLVNGALGGMQSPLGAEVKDPATGAPAAEASFRKAELIGLRVADLAAEAVGRARAVPVRGFEYHEKRIAIPVSNAGFRRAAEAGVFGERRRISPEGTLETVVGVLRLRSGQGPLLEAALVPGEMYPELSRGGVERYAGADFPEAPAEPAIKGLMRAPYRMLIGLANDEIGYIIPKAEWDEKPPWLKDAPRPWYGEVNSAGAETAPRIAAALAELLEGGGRKGK